MLSSLLIALLAGVTTCPVAPRAAFEWTHQSPRSWIVGIEEARWPQDLAVSRYPLRDADPAGRGALDPGRGSREPPSPALSAAVHHSRPWRWPDLEAMAAAGGLRRPDWLARLAVSQLSAPDYRESRWTALLATQVTAAHWLGLSWSALELAAGSRRTTGHELSVGWARAGPPWRASVVALGAWRTVGAGALRPPRLLVATLGRCAGPAAVDLQWRESEEGTDGRFGLRIATGDHCELRAAAASVAPRLRWGLALRHRRLSLEVAWLLHGELPSTQVLGVRWGDGE